MAWTPTLGNRYERTECVRAACALYERTANRWSFKFPTGAFSKRSKLAALGRATESLHELRGGRA